MGVQDFFTWRSQNATSNIPAMEEEDLAADVDEPPDFHYSRQPTADFHRSTVRPQSDRKESLLTKALHTEPEEEESTRSDIHVKTDLLRRRSLLSNASIASTADLTSDGGFTSPARTNTPSPPIPANAYTNFTTFSLGPKALHPIPPPMITSEKDSHIQNITPASPNPAPQTAEVPKKRCITFACGGRRPSEQRVTKPAEEKQPEPAPIVTEEAPKKRSITFACGARKPCEQQLPKPAEVKTVEPTPAASEEPPKRRSIKFACPGPRPSEMARQESDTKTAEPARRTSGARSPSLTRKPRAQQANSRAHRDSTGTVRRASQSPVAFRTSRPKYIIANESDLQSSDATRFSEFASEELQEDDWIRRDAAEEVLRLKKLTINDTLQKENAIRQLGNEAEEEALEDEEDEEDGYDSDDETRDDDDDDEDDDDLTFNGGSDYSDDGSDGNETDNEAGFADSDDENDEEYQFWTPGRHSAEASTYRPSAHRTASTSSIDSLDHMKPLKEANEARRGKATRRIKIRPGTPDLPDSTDFVCGTLDEDRPLEDAYISCMEARKFNHRLIPQDIDPSFPTSDPEEEEDEHDIIEPENDSEEPIWLHGEFEDSDTGRQGRRSTNHRSPILSPTRRLRSPPPPKRLHSPPPPAKRRLHSPPPRKLFGHSPRRMRSPPPARTIRSPAASPAGHATSAAITFAELGSRAGVTHTKSLPRTPNAFCRQYRAARLIAANGNDPDDGNDLHVRGAIDIVKGLEQKRQRRKEKFYQKQCNRARKGQQPERRPQPGKGAERMKELGLLMAGKQGHDQNPYILSA